MRRAVRIALGAMGLAVAVGGTACLAFGWLRTYPIRAALEDERRADSPVGVWQVDLNEMFRRGAAQVPEEQRRAMGAEALKYEEDMRARVANTAIVVVFRGNGTMIVRTYLSPTHVSQVEEGTWAIDGTRLTTHGVHWANETPTDRSARGWEGEFTAALITMKSDGPGPPILLKR